MVGAGQQYSVWDTGGNTHKTLGIENLPNHTHDIPASRNAGSSPSGPYLAHQDEDSQITTKQTSPIGGNESFDLRPPYYALAYIMKL